MVAAHHERALGEAHGRGILVVHPDPEILGWLVAELQSLGIPLATGGSGAAVLASLNGSGIEGDAGDGAPEVVVLADSLPDAPAEEVCQRLRADMRSHNAYIVVLGEAGAGLRGRGADEALPARPPPEVLRRAVRGGLRLQAARRSSERRHHRRAIAWIASVVAHEINNPLAVAISAHEQILDIADGDLDSRAVRAELRELADESMQALGRIRDSVRRLEWRERLHMGRAAHVTVVDLVAELHRRFAGLGRRVDVRAERRSSAAGVFEAEALLESAVAITRRALKHCGGDIEVTAHLDLIRVALVVEVGDPDGSEPEAILEPALESDGGPPRFEAALASIEACFELLGGQVFVAERGERWRFGLTLPMLPAADAEGDGEPGSP